MLERREQPIWKIRGGPAGEFEQTALDEGVIGIGFDGMPNEIRELMLEPTITFQEVKLRAGEQRVPPTDTDQLWRFIKEVKIGDLVVMPLKQGRGSWQSIAFGQVAGDYEFHKELSPFRHRRKVSWIPNNFPKERVDSGLRNFISAPGTLSHPQRPNIDKLWEIFENVSDIVPADSEGGNSSWDTFIGWAKLFYEWELFDEMERDYKLEVGANLAVVKEAFEGRSPDWEDRLEQAMRNPNATNLLDWRTSDGFLTLDQSRQEEALRRIWGIDPSTSLEERVRNFDEVAVAPFRAGGQRTSLISFLLMADDATQLPMYRYTPLQKAYQLTGYPTDANDSSDAWERYEYALEFFDKFKEEASARDLKIRDRLDAQSLVWCVTQYEPLEDWPQEVQDAFRAYQQGKLVAPPPPPDPEPEPVRQEPWSPANIDALARNLLWDPKQLQEIIEDLQEKRQVIFHGPPGTGKTYVAREIAKQCRLNGGDFEIVQFHPSYSYEDFVEGFRPKVIGGQSGFELVYGPLRRIAEQAKKNPKATFILVIDELNRGNVSKVFGELYFLLEYRDEEVRLQYGRDDERFSLPENLWFICTMNTADRSIALMDAALRRRFYFAPFFPDGPPVQGLLRRWLEREGKETLAADLIDAANAKLDRDTGIGPSYFMKANTALDEIRVRRIWERAVLPYVEEQCFGEDEKLKGFGFDLLVGQLNSASPLEAEPAEETAPAQGADADTDSA